jgi:hypothetical protein
MHNLFLTIEPQEQYVYFAPGILPLTYIELFSNVGAFILGIVLLIGINFEYDGQKMIYAWLWGIGLNRFYNIFLGVYIMVWIGGHRFTDVIYVIPESIVVAVYWIISTILMVAAILCVVSYWQELQDDLFGKEKRVKYHRKLANIRTAALSGVNTPYKSYYTSRSMLQLNQSQMSLSNA